jgi:hypothetical protein
VRWALNVVNANRDTLRSSLEAERDHFLLTSPIPTTELDELNDVIRKSYNGPPEITKSLVESRSRKLKESPHPDTPAVFAQMNGAIAAASAVLTASPSTSVVNVTISGSVNEKLGEAAPQDPRSRDLFGQRVSITLDFVR